MESSKAAITEFLSKGGQHDTTVHETVAPVVTHEVVNPTQHEEVTTAIEKEVHQDHYHTTVQPINDREVLPEVHTHALAPVEHLNFNHDSTDLNLQKLAEESAKYKDERTVLPTVNTTAAAPVVSAEHTHHHIHELIQPVIHKETIQPTVIHTTIPIHEVHHNAAQHHAASALPAMTLEEYKRAGGALAGRAERTDAFAGEPKSVDGATLLTGHKKRDSGIDVEAANNAPTKPRSADVAALAPAVAAATAPVAASPASRSSSVKSGQSVRSKPSLRDRLNPKIDANGDGKKGIFS